MKFAACGFVLLALLRIVSTYGTFSQTADEGHFVAGLEWLSDGEYTYEWQHPPLARIALAALPFVYGVRPTHLASIWDEGNHELAQGGHYWRNLTLARLGVLPFFLLACFILWFWSDELYGSRVALASVASFTFLPPILAHAGLATLDMAATSTVFCATYCWWKFLRNPSLIAGVLLGTSVAVAVLSKFSALLFLPATFLIVLLEWANARRANQANAKTVVRQRWLPGGWRCTRCLAASHEPAPDELVTCQHCGTNGCEQVPWPWRSRFWLLLFWKWRESCHNRGIGAAAQAALLAVFVCGVLIALMYRGCLHPFYAGIGQVIAHNETGHQTWLLGQYSIHGWWYFFPVVLAVKTPIGFLFLAGIGARRGAIATLCALALLLCVMPAHLNLGLRHILQIYPFLAMMAGCSIGGLFGKVAQAG